MCLFLVMSVATADGKCESGSPIDNGGSLSDNEGSPFMPVPVGAESPAPVRNPSPPREIIGLSDNIGGTAFSKSWLFTTLMKLIKVRI